MGEKKNHNAPTVVPTILDSTLDDSDQSLLEHCGPRDQAFMNELSDLTPMAELMDRRTPPGSAFQWLVNFDNVDPCEYETIQQRYALATLYFATIGDGWLTNNSTWLSDESECVWSGVSCGKDEEVTSLEICKWSFTFVASFPQLT